MLKIIPCGRRALRIPVTSSVHFTNVPFAYAPVSGVFDADVSHDRSPNFPNSPSLFHLSVYHVQDRNFIFVVYQMRDVDCAIVTTFNKQEQGKNGRGGIDTAQSGIKGKVFSLTVW